MTLQNEETFQTTTQNATVTCREHLTLCRFNAVALSGRDAFNNTIAACRTYIACVQQQRTHLGSQTLYAQQFMHGILKPSWLLLCRGLLPREKTTSSTRL